jgi:hypothetical protein
VLPVVYEKKWKLITFKRAIEDNANSYDFAELEIANEAKKSIIKEGSRLAEH